MRVFREEDPMDSGYTVISNDTLWVDLSCRALGLLTRWLSKPPGVEIDTIQDMITRGKRRGNKRMEGRDALYTASYELEEEGFLVRRLFTNEKGQHEWAAFVRSRPVPHEERSDPAGRKRDTAKVRGTAKPPAKTAKKAVLKTPKRAPDENPNPGNPFSGLTCDDTESSQVSPVTGFPDSGDPDSENQASSYQSSLHSSLSPQAGDQQQEGRGGKTRETAAPKDNNAPTGQAAEVADMICSLPGHPGKLDVPDLEPLVLDALAQGWTLKQLRGYLAKRCDPTRVYDVVAVYRKHLKRLPDAPTGNGSAPNGKPAETCTKCHGSGILEDPETFRPTGKCDCRTAPAYA